MKALFIPLKTEYYERFESGEKRDELRAYGVRWNELTCLIGRPVTLSKGYGKQNRINGVVKGFKKQHASTFGRTHQESMMQIYGTLDKWIAVISIDILGAENDKRP